MATWLQVRDTYERAVANTPPAAEKRFWQRYIYLWINYGLWEELAAKDSDRAREVYRAALRLIPHRSFTFGKVRAGSSHVNAQTAPVLAREMQLAEYAGMCAGHGDGLVMHGVSSRDVPGSLCLD